MSSIEKDDEVDKQVTTLRRELAEMKRVLRAYDAVTACLPWKLKVAIVEAHPHAYNGDISVTDLVARLAHLDPTSEATMSLGVATYIEDRLKLNRNDGQGSPP